MDQTSWRFGLWWKYEGVLHRASVPLSHTHAPWMESAKRKFAFHALMEKWTSCCLINVSVMLPLPPTATQLTAFHLLVLQHVFAVVLQDSFPPTPSPFSSVILWLKWTSGLKLSPKVSLSPGLHLFLNLVFSYFLLQLWIFLFWVSSQPEL